MEIENETAHNSGQWSTYCYTQQHRRSRTTGPATDVATTTAHQSPISGGQGLCVWVQSRRTSHHTLTDIMVPAIVIEPVVANLAPEPKQRKRREPGTCGVLSLRWLKAAA